MYATIRKGQTARKPLYAPFCTNAPHPDSFPFIFEPMNFFLVRTSRYSLRVTLMADVRSSYDSACKSVAVLSAGVVLLAKVPWDIFVL